MHGIKKLLWERKEAPGSLRAPRGVPTPTRHPGLTLYSPRAKWQVASWMSALWCSKVPCPEICGWGSDPWRAAKWCKLAMAFLYWPWESHNRKEGETRPSGKKLAFCSYILYAFINCPEKVLFYDKHLRKRSSYNLLRSIQSKINKWIRKNKLIIIKKPSRATSKQLQIKYLCWTK